MKNRFKPAILILLMVDIAIASAMSFVSVDALPKQTYDYQTTYLINKLAPSEEIASQNWMIIH